MAANHEAKLLQALSSVAQSIVVAAPADGELALRTLLRALREDSALTQLDALLALAPRVLVPASQSSSAPHVLPQVYARALAIQFEDAATLSSARVADCVDLYMTSIVLPTLSDCERVRTDPSLVWQVCRTAAQLAPLDAKGGTAACGRVNAMCCAGLGVHAAETTTKNGQIGVEAACMLAISLCDLGSKSDDTATLCTVLFPRALALVDAVDPSAALIISELLPRLLDSLPGDRQAARAKLAALFMDLISAGGDRRSSGLALGCRLAAQLLEDLRRNSAFWSVLRECLGDEEDLCRKRALFLLQAVAQGEPSGTNASCPAHVDARAKSGGNKSKTGGKKAGKRGRRNQGTTRKVDPGWPQFIWAYQAIETSAEALSPAWVQVVVDFGQSARLIGGPDTESALQLDVVPWVQLLLALGLRHRHPKVQQNSLHAALRGAAYKQRHDALSDGDGFVLACCDLLSTSAMAASMFRDVRAIEESTTWPIVMEVHAFLNRHVQHAPEFLRLWVRWFVARFRPSATYPPAAMLVWLQWLCGLPPQQNGSDPRAGLHRYEIAILADIATAHGSTTPQHTFGDGLSVLARQAVLSACVKLMTPPLDAPLAAFAPILAWASPSEIVAELRCRDDGADITALDWVRGVGPEDEDPIERLMQDVVRFLTADEQSTAMSETKAAQSLAASILLLYDGASARCTSSIDSITGLPIAIIEEAHAHAYQMPGRLERAVLLVARLIISASSQSPVNRKLQSWKAAESTAAAIISALRPSLLSWAKQGTIGEHVTHNGIDGSVSSAAQARADRLSQLQGTEDSDLVSCVAASSLTLLGWIADSSASAPRTISDVLGCLTSLIGDPAKLQIALVHLTQQLKTTVELLDINSLLTNLTSSVQAGWWKCLSAETMAGQSALPTPAALQVLRAADTALENSSAETTNDIIHGVGTVLTWLFDSAQHVPADALTEEVTACVEGCLRNSWHAWRNHLNAAANGNFAEQSILLSNVQSILHKGLMTLPAWNGPTSVIREIVQEMWGASFSCTDLAPVLSWHCCCVWSKVPSIASLYCEQVADMVCYTKVERHHCSDALAVHACENELLARGILLSYLEGIAAAHAESLGVPMIRAVMSLTKASVHRTPSREYELNSPTHKVKTSVWQALCVLVQVVVPNTPLASDMHDSAVELAAWEHYPSERQYLDLFLLRLLGRCPELISRWLPAALGNYELRPQIAQGILLVAGFVLLRLGQDNGAQMHLTHFKSLFPSIVTWVNSGHRQLRSLAQVLVVRLVADCKVRAHVARGAGDDHLAAEYESVGADEQLISLHSYLSSATEGSAFRDRLSTIVGKFDAELWCTAQQLTGRSNFVNGDGTHGDRVFTPVGKGADSLQLSEQAEGAPTACWLPQDILTRLATSLQREDSLSGRIPWEDLSIGRGRLETSVGDAPARRELIVVASLVEKTPNIAGLCRTCEMLRASSLVVADRMPFADAQFAPISMQTETWLPIMEVPPAWLMAFLEEQRMVGYQIIAVEQTSTSTTLEEFCWPKKAVLLLGKEKEGIPAEYLRVVDVCVEIPQLGVIRSLNVHVSGAIMCWEYVRQHESLQK